MPLISDKFQIQMFVTLVYQTLVLANIAAPSYLLICCKHMHYLISEQFVKKTEMTKVKARIKLQNIFSGRDIYHERR